MTLALDHFYKRVSFDNFNPPTIYDSYQVDNLGLTKTLSGNSSYNTASSPSSPPSSHPLKRSNYKNFKPILKNKDEISPISDSTQNGNSMNSGLNPPSAFRSRKKSLVEMTDEEILQLDSQFATKAVDVDQFKFENEFSVLPISQSSSKLLRRITQNAKNKTGYPTKPIIRTNSVCLSYKHELFSSDLNNNKYYFILLQHRMCSLGSIDYYLDKQCKDGDNVIICCSINDDNDIEEFANQYTDILLMRLWKQNPNLKIQVTFELFKNINYLEELINLYNPSMILVGSDFKQRRSSSVLSRKAFIPIVYVNANYSSDLQNEETPKIKQTTVTTKPSLVDSPGGVSFKMPFSTPTITIDHALNSMSIDTKPSSSQPIEIPGKKPSVASTLYSSNSSSSTTSLDSMNSFRKQRTNETAYSTLFEKLNDLPLIQDQGNTMLNEQAASKKIVKVKSLLDDLPVVTKTPSYNTSLSPFTKTGGFSSMSSGSGSGGLPSTDSYKPKTTGLSSIPGMMLPSTSPNTNSNSIMDQYNRRMSIQKNSVSSTTSKGKSSFDDGTTAGLVPTKIPSRGSIGTKNNNVLQPPPPLPSTTLKSSKSRSSSSVGDEKKSGFLGKWMSKKK